jgi:hypothetical protein
VTHSLKDTTSAAPLGSPSSAVGQAQAAAHEALNEACAREWAGPDPAAAQARQQAAVASAAATLAALLPHVDAACASLEQTARAAERLAAWAAPGSVGGDEMHREVEALAAAWKAAQKAAKKVGRLELADSDSDSDSEEESLESRLREAQAALKAARRARARQLARVASLALQHRPEVAARAALAEAEDRRGRTTWQGALAQLVQSGETDQGGAWSLDVFDDVRPLAGSAGGRHSCLRATLPGTGEVVLKRYDLGAEPGRQLARMLNEAQRLRKLRGAPVAEVLGVFYEGERGYLVLPHYDGGDLAQYAADRELSDAAREAVLRQVLRGLAAVHGAGVVHCDVKPENVLMTRGGEARLGDFDVSQDEAGRTRTLAMTVSAGAAAAGVAGTLAWMAPEVRRFGGVPTSFSDMFSFGQVAHWLHFGAPVAAGGAAPQRHASNEALNELLAALLAEDPARRPSAAEALRHRYFVSERAREELEAAPAHWRVARSLDGAGGQLRPAPELVPLLERLMNAGAVPALHGQGRDSHGAAFQRFRVVEALAVEHPALWRRYAARREEVRLQHPAEEECKVRSHDAEVWAALGAPSAAAGVGANEVLLFHGVPTPAVQRIITSQGFDERVSRLNGMLGAGVYFAESASKSDQYVAAQQAAGDECTMLLCRVALGRACEAGAGDVQGRAFANVRRAPCVNPACSRNARCAHARHGSVVCDRGGGTFREFVVYDRAQCYPEVVVRYRREA